MKSHTQKEYPKVNERTAILFAAGLGTRLFPHTENRPKALVEVGRHSLLSLQLRRLQFYGFRRVIINIHHHANRVERALRAIKTADLHIQLSDERDLLLDTGGGLKRIFERFRPTEPVLLHNVDILSDIDLFQLYQHHLQSEALATLAVSDRPTSRYLLFHPDTHQLVGWKNLKTGAVRSAREAAAPIARAYSGLAVIDPQLETFMPTDRPVFSIIDTLLESARTQPLYAYPHDRTNWLDVGKLPALADAASLIYRLPGLFK